MSKKLFAGALAGLFGAAIIASPALAMGRKDASQSEADQTTSDQGGYGASQESVEQENMGGGGTTGAESDTGLGVTSPSPSPTVMDDTGGAGATGAESDMGAGTSGDATGTADPGAAEVPAAEEPASGSSY